MPSTPKKSIKRNAGLLFGALILSGFPVLTHAEEVPEAQSKISQEEVHKDDVLEGEEATSNEETNIEEETEEGVKPEVVEEVDETIDEKPDLAEEVKPEVLSEEKPEVLSSDYTVTVKYGDTLNKIASKHKVTVSQIVEWNNIKNVNLITVGQKIIIKSGSDSNNDATQTPDAPKEDVKISKSMTPQEFVNTIAGEAQKVAHSHGLYASVMIAQASLESGYGDSSLSLAPNYNLFGIKGSYQGQSVTMNTREFSNGKWIFIPQAFKKYPSHAASFGDNARLLRNGLSWNSKFYAGTWVENASTYKEATQWLQGRYATDPAYASKLNRVIELFNLTQYDSAPVEDTGKEEATPTLPEETPEVKPDETPEETPEETQKVTYTVKSGDTLSHIAVRYKTTVAKLREENNIKGSLILVGQKLTIPGQKASSKPSKPNVPSKPATKPSTGTTTKDVTHSVKRGDTLSHIARQYKTSVSAIKSLNNLKSDLILVGQRLKVSSTTSNGSTSKPTTSKPSTSKTITVKRGDTLSHIAKRNGTSVARLKQLNGLKSDLIFINQKLKVN